MGAAGGLGGLLVALAVVPWSSGGERRRTGFELAHALERAGLVDSAPRRALYLAVFLLPAIGAVASVALLFRRPRAAGALAAAGGAAGVVAAWIALADGVRGGGAVVSLPLGLAAIWCGVLLAKDPGGQRVGGRD